MGAAPYIKEIRRKIGHDRLFLPAVSALVFNERGEVLLQKSVDTNAWMCLGGMPDPGEEPAAAIVREVFEETSVRAVPERISGVYAGPEVKYLNGDLCIYLTIVFVCRAVSGEAQVNDDESLEVGYFPVDALPPLRADHLQRITHALAKRDEAFFVGMP